MRWSQSYKSNPINGQSMLDLVGPASKGEKAACTRFHESQSCGIPDAGFGVGAPVAFIST